ncbi:urease accessory protein UreE [Hydrogenovibrio kuenenii]|uniref:urease accessory protein UreE n=1 Tax=Hydrogenovibrio kuenenii TaxID=63658 RepID=UPI0004BCC30A|nr:urease accessory protein UreE [Hydrogenovibrio kuenenii]
MREFVSVQEVKDDSALERLILTYAEREKSRLKAKLSSGEEVGLFLPRGTVLKHGDVLASAEGDLVQVVAAAETVSTVTAEDTHLLLRIAYHLGNRHVPLQVESNWLRYRHDHVLDDMVRLLGGTVTVEEQPVQPEGGAYGGGHHHEHKHDHDHAHGHHHH